MMKLLIAKVNGVEIDRKKSGGGFSACYSSIHIRGIMGGYKGI